MAGENVVVVGKAMKSNDYYLQLFRFSQSKAVDSVKIYQSACDIKISRAHSLKRKVAVLLL